MNTTATTLRYYNNNADAFVATTAKVDFHVIQNAFMAYLPPHATVLDVGCGSGRDSLAFLKAGLDVTAIDGSEAICAHASRLLGQKVFCTTFETYHPTHHYDGIWACASLLHLEREALIRVMQTLSDALVCGGCFYASFKYGTTSEMRDGRFFIDMTEQTFYPILQRLPDLKLAQQFITNDARPSHSHERWFNVFLLKH